MFFKNREVDKLKNQLAHFTINFHKASQTISDARTKFESVKQKTVKDFEELKKRTFEKTKAKVESIKKGIETERREVVADFQIATKKLDDKSASVDAIHSTIESLSLQDYNLE